MSGNGHQRRRTSDLISITRSSTATATGSNSIPVFAERMRKVGGDKAGRRVPRRDEDHARRAEHVGRRAASAGASRSRRSGAARPENTLDRATAMMPRLLYERLDEIGTRFRDHLSDRRAAPAAHQRRRDPPRGRSAPTTSSRPTTSATSSDRMTPAAIIPMHTPDEAIEELEFVTKQLGSKVGMFGSGMSRRVAVDRRATDPEAARLAVWYDVLALDSDHDYDPVWAKCVELGDRADLPQRRAATRGCATSPSELRLQPHRPFRRRRPRRRPRRIFLGGVTRRFPELRFAFLEGGVGWACQLFGDLIEHWERRNAQGAGAHGPAQARPRPADEPGREVRRCRHGRRRCARATAGPTTTRA